MKITEHVYLVGSGHYGISHAFDSSIYVVDCGSELVMIDTGAGCDVPGIIENIKKDGLNPEHISTILLTHSHADHAGGASALKASYGCKVCISKIESGFLAKGDDKSLKLDVAKRSGLYAPDYTFSPCKPSETLADGDRRSIGDFVCKSIMVPGHSEGSMCFQVNLPEGKALFTGDVVFAQGAIGLLNCDGSDLSLYRKHIGRLSGLDIDLLFPGHHVFVLSEGQGHIHKAIESLKLIGIPKNFL